MSKRVDDKLVERYGIGISQWARARRKQAGRANMQYLRHGRFFVLLATHGEHRFFEEEGANVRDVRRRSIKHAARPGRLPPPPRRRGAPRA